MDSVIHSGPMKGRTALHLAAQYGRRMSVDILLSHGANRHLVDGRGLTPLMVAILCERVECVTLLLDPKWNPDGDSAMRDALLCLAVYVRNDSIIEILLAIHRGRSSSAAPAVTSVDPSDHPSDIPPRPNVTFSVRKSLPIHLAVKMNRPDLLQLILSKVGSDSSVNYRISAKGDCVVSSSASDAKKTRGGGGPKKDKKTERSKSQKKPKLVVTANASAVKDVTLQSEEISAKKSSDSILGDPEIDGIEFMEEITSDELRENRVKRTVSKKRDMGEEGSDASSNADGLRSSSPRMSRQPFGESGRKRSASTLDAFSHSSKASPPSKSPLSKERDRETSAKSLSGKDKKPKGDKEKKQADREREIEAWEGWEDVHIGLAPLHLACQCGSVTSASILLSHGASSSLPVKGLPVDKRYFFVFAARALSLRNGSLIFWSHILF